MRKEISLPVIDNSRVPNPENCLHYNDKRCDLYGWCFHGHISGGVERRCYILVPRTGEEIGMERRRGADWMRLKDCARCNEPDCDFCDTALNFEE